MRKTTLNRGAGGETNFMKERLNVNICVRKVRCPHNFCQDCSYRGGPKTKNLSWKLCSTYTRAIDKENMSYENLLVSNRI
jgi:hypothetical protein